MNRCRKFSPGPHEGMMISVQGCQVSEDVVIRAHTALSLHRVRTVIPGIVHHHTTVVETHAQHERMVHHPVHQRLHLLLPVLDELCLGESQVPPAWEASVEILVVDVVPRVKGVTVGVS